MSRRGRGRGVAVVQGLEDYERTAEELQFVKGIAKGLMDIQKYYREQDAPQIGLDLLTAILKQAEMLQRHPDAGRIVPEFSEEPIRELIQGPFRVAYLRQAQEVVLTLVFPLYLPLHPKAV